MTRTNTLLTPALGLEQIISDLNDLSDQLTASATPAQISRWAVHDPALDGKGWYATIKDLTQEHPQARNFGAYPFTDEVSKDTYQDYFGDAPSGTRYQTARLAVHFELTDGYYDGRARTLTQQLSAKIRELRGKRSSDEITQQLLGRITDTQTLTFGPAHHPTTSTFYRINTDDGLFYTRKRAKSVWHVALISGLVDGECAWSYKPRREPQKQKRPQLAHT